MRSSRRRPHRLRHSWQQGCFRRDMLMEMLDLGQGGLLFGWVRGCHVCRKVPESVTQVYAETRSSKIMQFCQSTFPGHALQSSSKMRGRPLYIIQERAFRLIFRQPSSEIMEQTHLRSGLPSRGLPRAFPRSVPVVVLYPQR